LYGHSEDYSDDDDCSSNEGDLPPHPPYLRHRPDAVTVTRSKMMMHLSKSSTDDADDITTDYERREEVSGPKGIYFSNIEDP
jgi:hypothetical protein